MNSLVIEINEHSYKYVKLIVDNSNNLYYNNKYYKSSITKNNSNITIDTDFLELNEKNFNKLELNFDLSFNLISNSYFINGVIDKNVYIEDTKYPVIIFNDFNLLCDKFNKLFGNNELLCNILYNINTLDPNILIDNKPSFDFNITKNNLDLDNKKYAVFSNLDIIHVVALNYLFPEQYINESEAISNIIIKYSIEPKIFVENDKIYINVRNSLFDGLYDLFNYLQNIDNFIKKNNILHYFENKLENLKILENMCIEKEKGCCGGGSCDKGSECCQNDKKEEQKSNGCCKNKPDSECCKKNPEIKCDKETCGNYESCCGSKEPLQEKREEIVETELRDLYEKMNLDINNPGFILFLKGSKEEPKCKFSKPAVAKLNSIELDYKGYNILENEQLRSTLKYIHPTYPQLYYNYKFVCGGDLINDKDHDSLKLFLEELKEK